VRVASQVRLRQGAIRLVGVEINDGVNKIYFPGNMTNFAILS